jgi:Ca-activated chloride channel family protein
MKIRTVRSSGLVVVALLLFALGATGAFADSVRIAQIDNTRLLINQRVGVYVSVTDPNGDPIPNLTADNFTISEMGKERKILSFQRGANVNQGIKLLMVVDNSGSMYWDASGKVRNSADEKVWRITAAKEAVTSLLNSIKNPMDRVGLVTFNVKIESRIRLTGDKGEIIKVLRSIAKPAEADAYTELYETLYHSVDALRAYGGRKVIILLSDGQNFPLAENPNFPRRHGIDGAIRFAQQEGISVFTIGLSARADRENLQRIAEETGGAYFWVFDPAQLKNLYSLIRQQVLQEYLMIYRATMIPSERKPVRVVYTAGSESAETERFYYSGTVFGMGMSALDWRIFLCIPAACALLWLLLSIRFERKKGIPSFTVHGASGRKTLVHRFPVTQVQSGVTIGGSERSDIAISGDPGLRESQAKVTAKNGVFTITSKTPISVNNRRVTTKVLRSGDLITIGDTQVVFDAGVVKAEVKKAASASGTRKRAQGRGGDAKGRKQTGKSGKPQRRSPARKGRGTSGKPKK